MSKPRIFNNIKYLQLANENHLKNKSLEDNVYFTLRDIFANVSGLDYCMEANGFNTKLTNGISYEERTIDFTYIKKLQSGRFASCGGQLAASRPQSHSRPPGRRPPPRRWVCVVLC
jgi:hypothetical protein